MKMMRVAGRESAARRAIHVGRDVEPPAELDRRGARPATPDLGAQQHAGARRFHQDVGEPLDVARIAGALGRRAIVIGGRDARPGEVNARVQHVARYLEKRRSGRAVVALAKRHAHHVGDSFRGRYRRRELGDRLHHVDVRQVLQRAHPMLRERALAADQQHRALRAKRVGDAGDRVGGARPRRDHRASGLAGDAPVAVGGMGRDLLVAHVDDLDPLVQAAVVDVDDMSAAQREDGLDALVLERLGDQVAARDLRARVGRRAARASAGASADLLAAPAIFILLHEHFHFYFFTVSVWNGAEFQARARHAIARKLQRFIYRLAASAANRSIDRARVRAGRQCSQPRDHLAIYPRLSNLREVLS